MKTRDEYYTFVRDAFNNRKKMILIIGIVICVFELFFFGYALINFQGKWYQPGYVACYATLSASTIFCLLLCFLTTKYKDYDKLVTYVLHVYELVIMAWAITISTIDVIRGSYPVVFMIVSFAVPFFFVLHYGQNVITILLGTISILTAYFLTTDHLSIGYLSNIFVFAVISSAVNTLCYLQSLRRHNLENTLVAASTHDGLTKLFNRGALDNRLEQLTREETHSTVVMLDCDRFKQINDQHGHRFGDKALVKIAELITEKFGDGCYRYGGDEFIIITTLKDEGITMRLKEINEELANHFENIGVSITAGIYHVESGSTESSIISKADIALYTAKKEQKGSYYIYK